MREVYQGHESTIKHGANNVQETTSGVLAVGVGGAGTQAAAARAYGRKKLASCSGRSKVGQVDTAGGVRSTVPTNSSGGNNIINVIPGAPIIVKGADSANQEARRGAPGAGGVEGCSRTSALGSMCAATGGAVWGSLKPNPGAGAGAAALAAGEGKENVDGRASSSLALSTCICTGATGTENGQLHIGVRPMGHTPSVIPGAPIVVKRSAPPLSSVSHDNSATAHASSLDSNQGGGAAAAARKRERPSTAGSDQGGLVVKPGIGVGGGSGAGEEGKEGRDELVAGNTGNLDGQVEGQGVNKGDDEMEEWELQALKEQQELLALEMRIWEQVQHREQPPVRDDEEHILLQVWERKSVRVRGGVGRVVTVHMGAYVRVSVCTRARPSCRANALRPSVTWHPPRSSSIQTGRARATCRADARQKHVAAPSQSRSRRNPLPSDAPGHRVLKRQPRLLSR